MPANDIQPRSRERIDLAHEPDFWLGSVQVHPARREIVTPTAHETMEPRVMQVLVALARAKGGILSRNDLIEICWDGVVVGDDAINRCIGRLRRVAEATGDAISIETIPRVGYRLTRATDEPAVMAAPTVTRELADTRDTPPLLSRQMPKVRPSAQIIAFVIIVVFAAAAMLVSYISRVRLPHNASVQPVASLGVLPFVNMSGDPAKEYLSDGFAEELLNDLSNDPRLRVAARTSAFAFKGKNEDVRAIARALGVRSIVEGSMREAGNRVRITAQLIDGVGGYHIWSATFDRNFGDILTVQDEIARAIAAALTHRLVPRVASVPPGTIDPAVYRQYLQARQQLNEHWRATYAKSFALFKEVTARKPDFADAFAGLARAALNLSEFDAAHSNADRAAADAAAQRALFLDPHNLEAREIRLGLELYAWDWKAAASDVGILRYESPNNIRVLAGLRAYYNQMGFPQDAVAIAERALSLDPLSDEPRLVTTVNLLYTGRYGEAVDATRAVLSRQPDHPRALAALCTAYARTGRADPAREIARRLDRLNSSGGLALESQTCNFEIDVASGNVESARKIVESWEAEFPDKFVFAREIADRFVQLEDFDNASVWYERAYDRREPQFFQAVYWPLGAHYRRTARWQQLTQQPLFKAWQAEHDRIAYTLTTNANDPQ